MLEEASIYNLIPTEEEKKIKQARYDELHVTVYIDMYKLSPSSSFTFRDLEKLAIGT